MDQIKTDDPKKEAKAFLEKMKLQGYSLELSMESLMENIEPILESSLFLYLRNKQPQSNDTKGYQHQEHLESGLEAYVGEILCQKYNGKWEGTFSSSGFLLNFYSVGLQFGSYHVRLSHYLSYRLTHGKKEQGTFAEYMDRILHSIQARKTLEP